MCIMTDVSVHLMITGIIRKYPLEASTLTIHLRRLSCLDSQLQVTYHAFEIIAPAMAVDNQRAFRKP